MNFRDWKVACWTALLSGAGLVLARGGDTVAPPHAPVPSLSSTLTNLNSGKPRQDGMRRLEEELGKSLQPFSPAGIDNLLTPRYFPMPVPIMPNRLPSSNTEKRGNWPFGEDSSGIMTPDPFKSLEGSPGKGSLEEIYNSLGRKQSDSRVGSAKSRGSSSSGFDPFDGLDDKDLALPSNIRESARKLRDRLLGTGSIFNRSAGWSSLSEALLPQENSPSPEQIQAHEEYLQRFRDTLNIPAPIAMPQNTMNSLLGLSPVSPSPTTTKVYTPSSLPNGSASSGNIFAATPSEMNAALHPAALPDLNDHVLNQWNPLYAPPKLEPAPTPRPFSPPMMEVPRRPFL